MGFPQSHCKEYNVTICKKYIILAGTTDAFKYFCNFTLRSRRTQSRVFLKCTKKETGTQNVETTKIN